MPEASVNYHYRWSIPVLPIEPDEYRTFVKYSMIMSPILSEEC